MGGVNMDALNALGAMSVVLTIVSIVISIACIVGAIFIYKVYVSTCSFSEFMKMVKTKGYFKSLFRFDTFASPKILQFLYGLNALGVIGTALILLITSVFTCFTVGDIRVLLGGIIGCILVIVIGEILVRVLYEFSILFFKMNENLKGIKESLGAQGTVKESAAAPSFEDTATTAQPQAPDPVPATKFCPNCGTQNKVGAKFCKGCGSAL